MTISEWSLTPNSSEEAVSTHSWFAEVMESLNNSRLQSVSYRDQLEQILQEARRDVRQVDWRHQVPHLLSEASEHIEIRFALEENIRVSAHDKLDHAASPFIVNPS